MEIRNLYHAVNFDSGRLAPLKTKQKLTKFNKHKRPKGTSGKPLKKLEKVQVDIEMNPQVNLTICCF